MNIETQKQHFADLVKKSEDILFRKGNDYANTDRLSNFKLAGAIAGGTPEMNCLNLIATKVARLGVLLNSDKAPDNESVRDSIIDLINYGILLDMILEEKAGEKDALKTSERFMADLMLRSSKSIVAMDDSDGNGGIEKKKFIDSLSSKRIMSEAPLKNSSKRRHLLEETAESSFIHEDDLEGEVYSDMPSFFLATQKPITVVNLGIWTVIEPGDEVKCLPPKNDNTDIELYSIRLKKKFTISLDDFFSYFKSWNPSAPIQKDDQFLSA